MSNILFVFVILFVYHALSQYNIMKDNRNRSTQFLPENEMPLSEIPLFIVITLQESLSNVAYDWTQKIFNENNINKNGDIIPVTHYIDTTYSNYKYIQNRYLDGSQIVSHGVYNNDITSNSDLYEWYYQLHLSREYISIHAGIPLYKINGFRSPYFSKGLITTDNMYNTLNGIFYYHDSSVQTILDSNDNEFIWPYTFNRYDNRVRYTEGNGPSKSYPGLWEIPVYYVYDINKTEIGTKYGYYDYYDNDTSVDFAEVFKWNYIMRNNSNRAPMQLNFRNVWFANDNNTDALNRFIQWAVKQPNTWFVTVQQLIEWMNNPVPNSVINQNGKHIIYYIFQYIYHIIYYFGYI